MAPRPRLLRALAWPLALGVRPFPLAPRVSPADLRARPARRTPARGEVRMRAAMLEGCVQRVFFGRVNRAAAAVLAADGCEVVVPGRPGLLRCPRPARRPRGRGPAAGAATRSPRWAGFERVVVTAAGCGSAMKEYGDLLDTDEARRFSASVRDVTELCAELGPVAERAPHAPVRVAYQDACHLRQAQGVAAEPRALLAAIPGVELVEIEQPDMCCGSAGIYNLLEPATARELGARKARAVLDAAPDVLATANPGCAIQIAAALRRAGHPGLPIVHPVELVAAALGLLLLGVAERERGRGEDRGDDHSDPFTRDAPEPIHPEHDDQGGDDPAGDDPHRRSACAHAPVTIPPAPLGPCARRPGPSGAGRRRLVSRGRR